MTPNLMLPEVPLAIRDASADINSGFLSIDTILQLAVISRVIPDPPQNALQGQRWIVPSGATGAWANHVNHIALRTTNGWRFYVPRPGWLAWSVSDSKFYVYHTGMWNEWAVSDSGGGGSGIDHSTDFDDFEDFVNARANGPNTNSAPWSSEANGSGALYTVSIPAEGNHLGVVGLGTGTTSTGSARLARMLNASSITANGAILDGDVIYFDALVRFPDVPSSTQNYVARLGFGNRFSSAAPTDGVVCEVVESSGSARWRLTAYNAGSETNSLAASGPLNNTWHLVRIAASASGAELLIDGALVATLSTGLPTQGFMWGFQIIKTSGSQERFIHIDLCHVYKTFTTPRY